MSALSFVALELQTTHLDPASVSQASYVKLVNGNITRTDSWSVIPPTVSDISEDDSAGATKTWQEALPQLNMMVGQLPIVSYYRDADKEVLQAASRHIGETAPVFHWLDCRELARKFLPNLPEFQLSTVLKALDLYDEYADSEAVEQTTQIVVELARRDGATTVEELWGDLFNQPDDILGIEPAVDDISLLDHPLGSVDSSAGANGGSAEGPEPDSQDDGLEDVPKFLAEPDAPDTEVPEPAEDLVGSDPDEDAVTAAATTDIAENHVAEGPADVEDHPTVTEASAENDAPVDTSEEATTEDDQSSAESSLSVEPQTVESTDQPFATVEPLDSSPESGGEAYEEPAAETIEDVPHEEPAVTPAADIDANEEQLVEPASATANETPTAVPVIEAVDIPARSDREERRQRRSAPLRAWSFLGIFGFGLVTVIGLMLTVMAVLLFFTENDLMLEAKIAGVILTGAITLLSMLMTTISYQSFRKN